MFEEILKALGLAPGSGEALIMSTIATLQSDLEAAQATISSQKPVLLAMGDIAGHLKLEDGATPSIVTAQVMVLSQTLMGHEDVVKERDALAARVIKLEGVENETIVASAIAAGKITSAQHNWAMEQIKKDRTVFEQFIASAVAVKPADGPIDKPASARGAGGSPETEESLKIMAMTGVTSEMMKEHGPDDQEQA